MRLDNCGVVIEKLVRDFKESQSLSEDWKQSVEIFPTDGKMRGKVMKIL